MTVAAARSPVGVAIALLERDTCAAWAPSPSKAAWTSAAAVAESFGWTYEIVSKP